MKQLLLLRHAKSDWDDVSLRDIERPLAKRGRRDAPRMGRALKARQVTIDYVLCSPATRARQTMELFTEAAGIKAPVEFEEHIYDAGVADLIKVVRALPDEHTTAILIGHNPGFESLLGRLTGLYHTMPTAALACMELPVEHWQDVEGGKGKLLWLLTPKTLED
jgi:phosphohistidine phosphatase